MSDTVESGAVARRSGRPTKIAAAELGERILAAATGLFLSQGFGATSIEGVAALCGMSKRTFYHRFRDKPDLFRAVVHRLIERWASPLEAQLHDSVPLEESLRRTARQILAAALSPEALALYRLLIAEAQRFPELARITAEQSAAGGGRIAQLLEREARAGHLDLTDSGFAAEQFINMVLAAPRRRALGLGPAMTEPEIERWIERTITLFLDGSRARDRRQ